MQHAERRVGRAVPHGLPEMSIVAAHAASWTRMPPPPCCTQQIHTVFGSAHLLHGASHPPSTCGQRQPHLPLKPLSDMHGLPALRRQHSSLPTGYSTSEMTFFLRSGLTLMEPGALWSMRRCSLRLSLSCTARRVFWPCRPE